MPAQITSFVAALRRLGCTPAEALALAILAAAAAAIVALLWLADGGTSAPLTSGSPSEEPSDGAGVVLTEGEVIVHVAGAVAKPGVYTLPGGSRVGDALVAAGGTRPRAVVDGLNLARPLTDGEQVLVPDRASTRPAAAAAAPGGATPAPSGGAPSPGAVSLNTATVVDLEALPGIGPVLAQAIVDYRDSVGGFKNVSELRDVSGIGEKTFQALAPLVTL